MSDPIPDRALIQQLMADGAVLPDPPPPTAFPSYTLRQLHAIEHKPLMVEKLFSPGHHGMLFGPPNNGKTFAGIDMAVRGALGLPIFGKLPVQHPFKTLICAAEGSLDKLAARLITAAHHYGLDLDADMIRLIPAVPDLFSASQSDNGLAAFESALDELKFQGFVPTLIIFDTQSDMIGAGNPNNDEDAKPVLDNLAKIRRDRGCATLNLHHPTKSGEHYSGAALWLKKCDFSIEIVSDTNPRIIKCRKVRDGERFKDIAGNLTSVPDPRNPNDPALTSAVFDWLDGSHVGANKPQQQRARNQAEVILKLREDCVGSGSKKNPPKNALSYTAIAKSIGLSPNPVKDILNSLAAEQTGVRKGENSYGAVYWWDAQFKDEEL